MGFATGFCFGFLVICVLWIVDAVGIESPYKHGFRDGYEAALREIRRKMRASDVSGVLHGCRYQNRTADMKGETDEGF